MRIRPLLSICLSVSLGACVGTVDGDSTGESGGSDGNGKGGSTGGGGSPGNGGSLASGGSVGSGGMGSGGQIGSGGVTGAGGLGTGGTSSSGGTTGMGGRGIGGNSPGMGGRGAGGAMGIGGSGSAGTPGLGPWTTGYAATMYGNSASGDCAGYPNFSDATPIATATCRGVVTVAGYSAGVANNASYYGATGDLSTLWVGAQCVCQGGGTENCPANAAPSCPAERAAGGNCGICVAVKCDPTGTITIGGTTHTADCNRTQYAVVQIIDACPHNHATNVASSEGWCTSRQANHIDLSCSALGGISTRGMNIGQLGWLNVDVQRVDCSIGLGLHPL